jgi:hypothetical protein
MRVVFFKRTKPSLARVSVEEQSMSGYAATIIALAIVIGPLEEARAQTRHAGTQHHYATRVAGWNVDRRRRSGQLRERWTPPAGGAMLAVSRTLKAIAWSAFEFLRIVERDGRLIYIAQPNGRPANRVHDHRHHS